MFYNFLIYLKSSYFSPKHSNSTSDNFQQLITRVKLFNTVSYFYHMTTTFHASCKAKHGKYGTSKIT